MRGKRLFKKHFSKTASGVWRWSVISNDGYALVGRGVAETFRRAERLAMDCEKRSIGKWEFGR